MQDDGNFASLTKGKMKQWFLKILQFYDVPPFWQEVQ